MPSDRFFVSSPFGVNQEVIIQDTEFHHLANVMRHKEGESIELVNGQGSLAKASIKRIEKKQAYLIIESILEQQERTREIILAQAVPRINRLDFIIEKGTELGATQFWLFPGDLSERNLLTDHQINRLQNQVIAAMKQCGRLFLPKIEIKPKLSQWKNIEMASYFGDTRSSAKSFKELFNSSEDSLFFVGPEAGFSDQEVEHLMKLSVLGVKLHVNILRTDTAALVALTIMSN